MQRHNRADQSRHQLMGCSKTEGPHVNDDVAAHQSDAAELDISEKFEDGHASTYRMHRNANPSLVDLETCKSAVMIAHAAHQTPAVCNPLDCDGVAVW